MEFNYNVLSFPDIEDLFNEKREPKLNCPTIDGHITDIRHAIRYVTELGQIEETSEKIENISYYLDEVPEQFEDLREKIVELRQWDQSWKDLLIQVAEREQINLLDYIDEGVYQSKLMDAEILAESKKIKFSEIDKFEELISDASDQKVRDELIITRRRLRTDNKT